jgi:hypothetical protein
MLKDGIERTKHGLERTKHGLERTKARYGKNESTAWKERKHGIERTKNGLERTKAGGTMCGRRDRDRGTAFSIVLPHPRPLYSCVVRSIQIIISF